MASRIVYAAAPTVHLREGAGAGKKLQQLLFGDRIKLADDAPRSGEWVRVKSRRVEGWIREHEYQEAAMLEVTFVDVGQGDGCLMVTPDDRHYVIDAGKGRDMADFLAWRYGLLGAGRENVEAPKLEAAIFTHSDTDHFLGFRYIFDHPKLRFRHLYHNGIVERGGKGKARFGAVEEGSGGAFLVDLVERHGDLNRVLKAPDLPNTQHLQVLAQGKRNKSFRYSQMLDARDRHMGRHGPSSACSVQVLGPVVERAGSGKNGLRWLKTDSHTKNGHSVTLRVQYHNVSILLGGDLNDEAQRLLLRHHTGIHEWDERDAMGHELASAHRASSVAAARNVLRCDVAKACHHGSSDLSEDFLAAIDAHATVVSSGDEEGYAHPRPDALGAFGKHGRGRRPLVFSTELARTTKDLVLHPRVLHRRMEEIDALLARSSLSAARRADLEVERARLEEDYPSKVAIQGSIYLRTDGHRMVLAQKLETSSASLRWFAMPLVQDGDGEWREASKREFVQAAPVPNPATN